jgi:hypothetical protein
VQLAQMRCAARCFRVSGAIIIGNSPSARFQRVNRSGLLKNGRAMRRARANPPPSACAIVL